MVKTFGTIEQIVKKLHPGGNVLAQVRGRMLDSGVRASEFLVNLLSGARFLVKYDLNRSLTMCQIEYILKQDSRTKSQVERVKMVGEDLILRIASRHR